MKLRSIPTAVLLPLLLVACQDRGTPPPPAMPQASEAASHALGVLRQLVTAENYRAMGFDSPDEVRQAEVGDPLPVANIELEDLRKYQPGPDPASLIKETNQTVYPVTVNGAVKSSLTLVKTATGYEPAAFGNSDVAKRLGRYRQAGGPKAIVVRVPALNFYFVGQQTPEGLVLTPIVSDPRLRLAEGQPVAAEQVLTELVPVARAYNGLPL